MPARVQEAQQWRHWDATRVGEDHFPYGSVASHHWGSSLPSRAITGVVGGPCSLCSAPILSVGTGPGLGALVGALAAVRSWNSVGTGQAQ